MKGRHLHTQIFSTKVISTVGVSRSIASCMVSFSIIMMMCKMHRKLVEVYRI